MKLFSLVDYVVRAESVRLISVQFEDRDEAEQLNRKLIGSLSNYATY